ncbi:unnamed protein product [Rotaria sp. Silwood1]|nr:unnamed protein product [Rotaria sp. Silwood1]CAF4864157.1 unnamed protein product [Rotaria sp. Silwood1]
MSSYGCVRPPAYVRDCIIRNDSDGHVQIRLIYESSPEDNNSTSHSVVHLGQGQIHRVDEKIVDHGSWTAVQPLQRIEVTRSDGQTMHLAAPFEGVNTVVRNWLFVIENGTIKSTGRSS